MAILHRTGNWNRYGHKQKLKSNRATKKLACAHLESTVGFFIRACLEISYSTPPVREGCWRNKACSTTCDHNPDLDGFTHLGSTFQSDGDQYIYCALHNNADCLCFKSYSLL